MHTGSWPCKVNKRQRIPKGPLNIDNPDKDKQNKNTTQYVLDTTMRKSKQAQITQLRHNIKKIKKIDIKFSAHDAFL